jgi:hypothetical protein
VTEVGHEAPVKVYMNRGPALLIALCSAASCALGAWVYLDRTIPPVTTNPFIYTAVGRTILSVFLVVIGFFGLWVLYVVFIPLPMFEFDATGITYRWPFKWGSLRWDEMATITASKEVTDSRYPRFTTSLTLRITLTQGAVVAGGRRSRVTLRFGQALLPMSIEELVWHIRKYHAVITLGGFPSDD